MIALGLDETGFPFQAQPGPTRQAVVTSTGICDTFLKLFKDYKR